MSDGNPHVCIWDDQTELEFLAARHCEVDTLLFPVYTISNHHGTQILLPGSCKHKKHGTYEPYTLVAAWEFSVHDPQSKLARELQGASEWPWESWLPCCSIRTSVPFVRP